METWVCSECGRKQQIPAVCGRPRPDWVCQSCMRKPLSPWELLGANHDMIPLGPVVRRPARVRPRTKSV